MPLQWLSLQQRQQQGQRRSPISQALKPQGGGQPQRKFLGTMDTSNRFVEEQKAKWAEEDKLKKLERDKQTQGAQELGMRVGKAMQGQQQGAAAQAEQQAIAKEKVETDPESAAKEMYNLILTLPDEAKSQLLNQIFTPTAPSGTITSAGKQVTMPEKYNPIASVFLEKGWAMFDAKGNVNLSEPEREFEKGTFEIVERGGKVYRLNTATKETIILGTIDEPEDVVNAINKQANDDALALSKEGEVSFEDAKYDALIDNGVNPEIAADMAKIKEIPKDPSKSNWFKDTYKKAVDWVKSRGAKPATKEDWEKAAGKIVGETFNEVNASALVDVISDDVTAAERAHLKSQGASDADINEAIKRKGSK